MTKRIVPIALLAVLAACGSPPADAPETTAAPEPTEAPRVILIIGDGMDDHQITIADLTGVAVQDVMIATAVYDGLLRR